MLIAVQTIVRITISNYLKKQRWMCIVLYDRDMNRIKINRKSVYAWLHNATMLKIVAHYRLNQT